MKAEVFFAFDFFHTKPRRCSCLNELVEEGITTEAPNSIFLKMGLRGNKWNSRARGTRDQSMTCF